MQDFNYEEQLKKFKSLLRVVYGNEHKCVVISTTKCSKVLVVYCNKNSEESYGYEDELNNGIISLEGEYVLDFVAKVYDLATMEELYTFENNTKIQTKTLEGTIILLTGENTDIIREYSANLGTLRYKSKETGKPKETLHIITNDDSIREVDLSYYISDDTMIEHSICNRIRNSLVISEHITVIDKARMKTSSVLSNISGDILAECKSLITIMSIEDVADNIIFHGAKHELIKIGNPIETNIVDRITLKCPRRISYYPCRFKTENGWTSLLFMHICKTKDMYVYNFDTQLINRVKLDLTILHISGIVKLLNECMNTSDEERRTTYDTLIHTKMAEYNIKAQISTQKKLETKLHKKDLEDLSKFKLSFLSLTQVGPNDCILGSIGDLVNAYRYNGYDDLESNIKMYDDAYLMLSDKIDIDRCTAQGTPYYVRSRQLKKLLFNNAIEIAKENKKNYINALSITDEVVTPSEIKRRHGFK